MDALDGGVPAGILPIAVPVVAAIGVVRGFWRRAVPGVPIQAFRHGASGKAGKLLWPVCSQTRQKWILPSLPDSMYVFALAVGRTAAGQVAATIRPCFRAAATARCPSHGSWLNGAVTKDALPFPASQAQIDARQCQ